MSEITKYFRFSSDVESSFRELLIELNWKEYSIELNGPLSLNPPNLTWKTSRYLPFEYNSLNPSKHRINHFPKSYIITKKDSLARCMKRMKQLYPQIYNFTPITFILPTENDLLKSYIIQKKKKNKEINNENMNLISGNSFIFIIKPASSSRGRGIRLIDCSAIEKNSLSLLLSESKCEFDLLKSLNVNELSVIQEYIHQPLLYNGYKCDFRYYVLVTSFKPLKAFVCKYGIVRFSSQKYSLNNLNNQYIHLTNSSINKKNYHSKINNDEWPQSGKLTFDGFYSLMPNLNRSAIENRCYDILLLTLLCAINDVPIAESSFELFGFDLMIDEKMNIYLIEVNASPALAIKCEVDEIVKKPMLKDMIQIIEYDCLIKHSNEKNSKFNSIKKNQQQFKSLLNQSSSFQSSFNSSPFISRSNSSVLGSNLTKLNDNNQYNNEYEFKHENIGCYQQLFPFNNETFRLNEIYLNSIKNKNKNNNENFLFFNQFVRLIIQQIKLRQKLRKKIAKRKLNCTTNNYYDYEDYEENDNNNNNKKKNDNTWTPVNRNIENNNKVPNFQSDDEVELLHSPEIKSKNILK